MSEITERLAKCEAGLKSSDKRQDSSDKRQDKAEARTEVIGKRVHELSDKHHTVVGIVTGIEGAIKSLTTNVAEWSKDTKENTNNQIKNRTTVVVAFAVTATLGSAFFGFAVFVGGTFLKWW